MQICKLAWQWSKYDYWDEQKGNKMYAEEIMSLRKAIKTLYLTKLEIAIFDKVRNWNKSVISLNSD
jgi:hypothetical protein